MNLGRGLVRAVMVFICLAFIYLFLQFPQFIGLFRRERTLNILAWPKTFSAGFVQEFEQTHNVKVNVTFFENYEELFVKLYSGHSGYDLVTAANYTVQLLTSHNLLKPLDASKLPFDRIYPQLLNPFFDSGNRYTIPYVWDVFGLGINRKVLPEAPESWGLLFDTEYDVQVGMLDDAREACLVAAYYLFGPQDTQLTDAQIVQLKQLLFAQKKRVAMYTDLRADYILLSEVAPVVLLTRSDITHRRLTVPHLDFIIPKEGSFLLIDSFAISATTQKDDLIYEFLNFAYRPDIYQLYVNEFGAYSVQKEIPAIDPSMITPLSPEFAKLHFMKNIISEPQLNQIWIGLKSH